MDLTGGGVFQTEALDSPRKSSGMKYITCDNCGDEQVHMKHQVKCRKCHRNFNFAAFLASAAAAISACF